MTTRMDSSADAWWNALSSSAGRAVTYRRGDASVGLTAVPGRTRVEAASGDGATVLSRVRDWIIRAADLVLSGQPVEPETADEISETSNGQVLTFQVLALAGETFEWMGQDARYLRVHVKLIGSVPEE